MYAISTSITRDSAEYGPVELDVTVHFVVSHVTPGSPAVHTRRNGDPGWPADPAEYEFAIAAIELHRCDDAPGPLTDAERASITAWFDAAYEAACEAVGDYAGELRAAAADARYDQWREARAAFQGA